jgi:hypothetical protein
MSTRLYIRLHAAGKQLAARLRWAEGNKSEILSLRDSQASEKSTILCQQIKQV